ncbi:short chain dehydrogenase reductase [Stagonosporopsis vannaccii]|nr:short chain dehydrogenase reductase [Stagonosporopsis vannaccii]
MGSHFIKTTADSSPSSPAQQKHASHREWRKNRHSAYGGPQGAYVGTQPYIAGYGVYDDGSTGNRYDVYERHGSDWRKDKERERERGREKEVQRVPSLDCALHPARASKYQGTDTCPDSTRRLFGAIQGRLYVLINNTGVAEPWRPIGEPNTADYIKTLNVSLKGPYPLQNAFLPLLCSTAEKTRAYVNIVNVVAMHPGGVETSLSDGHADVKKYLLDTAELCGGFTTWLTAQDRNWLNGRYTSVNWYVDVLEGMREEIVKRDKLKVKLTI